MVRRWLGAVTVGAVAFGIAACDKIPGYGGNGTATATTANGSAAPWEKNVNIGEPLFPPEEPPKAPKIPAPTTAVADPIIISGAQITVPYTENVPTKNNGKLWQICTELVPGAQVAPEDIFEHPVVKEKKYRRLREGDVVAPGQLVALLDDKIAQAKYNAAKTDLEAAGKKLVAAKVFEDKSYMTFDIYKKNPQIGSKIDLYKAEQDWAAAQKQSADTEGERDKAREALKIAAEQLAEHELRATIGGVIKTIYRKPGESVKELEPVLQIQNLDRLRAEGMLPVEFLPLMPNPTGKTVYLEPSSQLGPQQELVGHWSAVTGVAVSKDSRRPSIVTAGEDKTVRVWDRITKNQRFLLTLDVPVRALACTTKGQLNLAIFGGDDGQAQILDLERLGEQDAVRKLEDTHKSRINSVAFSPDGSFSATADDKEVIISETATGKKKYRFNAQHRGPITSIQFTPQSKLVTVARDRTIRVFDLGDKGAKLASIIENRSGNVDLLGVSHDGQKILFDQERSLHVRNIPEQRTEAFMLAPSESSQFTGFAIFSPDSSLVAAAGTGDIPLGIWKLPAPGSTRAFQRVRLAVGGSVPSCAAFDPNGGFLVVGTQDHRVLVFARPEKTDLDKVYSATIRFVGRSMESTEKKVPLWAELPNPGMPLLPGDTVTMVIPQQ